MKIANLLNSSFFWLFSFTVLFFLSLDFWSWERETTFAWLGLPGWVFYFMGLQIILAIALLVFTITYWQTESQERDRD